MKNDPLSVVCLFFFLIFGSILMFTGETEIVQLEGFLYVVFAHQVAISVKLDRIITSAK